MGSQPSLSGTIAGERAEFTAAGSWTIEHVDVLQRLVEAAAPTVSRARALTINAAAIEELDTLGAWLLERLMRTTDGRGSEAGLVDLSDRYRGLFDKIHEVNRAPAAVPVVTSRPVAVLENVGRAALDVRTDLVVFLEMLAALAIAILRVLRHPQTFRLTSAVYHVFRVGWQAVPIILLITFLIGAIIAQQGIFHFRKFGAESYVVDMVGILVLRELGVLIVSIMVAGRSGSAYTAELGSMKMREEIDALRTMGFDPVEILILPRVLALVIALPILAFVGAMAALYGGGLVAWLYGGMSPEVFVARLREVVSVTHFEVGMIKAPFMALVIGVIACSEGLRVTGSAESLGHQTTVSVVKSIFLVIVLDGLFAVFFASIGM
ncbi:MAG: MlaE family lipid ABC transporter permease subunit [Xanthobacteraceae bacterium]|nr:MlaE family lipid ABC transporter permease subunit [Xanthobacteraceae bacterium]PWB64125.1 MAG: ABC transporter permease [Bradyrhizobiaceae bacterium]